MAELFSTSRTNIIEHINNIYEEEELDKTSTCQNFRQVRKEGNRNVTREIPFYNLDMIISLGYRIKSKVAINFRVWATAVDQNPKDSKSIEFFQIVQNKLHYAVIDIQAPEVVYERANSDKIFMDLTTLKVICQ